MKKILVISPFFYPHIGGSEQYMEEIYVQFLKEYPQFQVDILCYNTNKSPSFEKYRGLNIYRIPGWQLLPDQFVLPEPISLLKFLSFNRGKYFLIHCNTRFFDSTFWVPSFAKISGAKIILTDHCANHPVHKNFIINNIAKLIDLILVNFFLKSYDLVLATNDAAKQFLLDTFNIKAPVIYGGVSKDFYPSTSKNSSKTVLTAIFVGRMIESKGPQLLFNITQKLPEVKFLFAGPGPLTEKFKKEVALRNLKHVKILGGLTRRQVARIMAKAHILVHPSYHHEGFPNVLTEGGAARLAVIATDTGGTKEIIIHNKTGLLVKPKDSQALEQAFRKLIQDSLLRDKLAQNLYLHVQNNFTWEKAARQLYQQMKKKFSCLSDEGRGV